MPDIAPETKNLFDLEEKPEPEVKESAPSAPAEQSESTGSGLEAEAVNTSAESRQDTEPMEFVPETTGSQKTEPPREMPAFDDSRVAKEMPSFDDSAESRVGNESELGALSNFFKQAKQTVSEPVSGQSAKEAGESSEPKIEPEPAQAESSMSQIEIRDEESSRSDFKPGFEKPLFPDFTAPEGRHPAESVSDSAVSRPFEPSRVKVIASGMIDLFFYLVIAFALSLAGQWASGANFRALAPGEIFKLLVLPIGLMICLVVWFYQLFFISVLGQTLGGMILGIEVLDRSGSRPGLGRASLRALIYLFCLIPFGLGFLPALLGNSLTDRLARTRLVRW